MKSDQAFQYIGKVCNIVDINPIYNLCALIDGVEGSTVYFKTTTEDYDRLKHKNQLGPLRYGLDTVVEITPLSSENAIIWMIEHNVSR